VGQPLPSRPIPMPVDPYKVIAKYYDSAYAAKPDLVDLPFYVNLAAQSRGPVLEVACGTGRVLLPIARKGIEICGVDNSPAMLDILKEHLALEPQDVRRKVTMEEGDMRNFRLNRKYPLVIIPFRPMQHMFAVDDQVAALTTAAAHLTKEGLLAFDGFYPKFELISTNIGEEVAEMQWSEPSDPTRTTRRFFRKDSVDKIHQVFSFTFIFRTYQADTLLLEETEAFKLCYYTYPHLRALFKIAGLVPVAEYGSFAKVPLDNHSEQMIFVLRKA
jgi:SAM-dependent methyltransferase